MKSLIISLALAFSAAQAAVVAPNAVQAVEERDNSLATRAPLTFVIQCQAYKGTGGKPRKGAKGKK